MLKDSVRKEYAHIKQKEKRIIQIALDASGNGRCWWVYQHILASLGVGERSNREANEWNARIRSKETSIV
mgnify:CR=1 FL=1